MLKLRQRVRLQDTCLNCSAQLRCSAWSSGRMNGTGRLEVLGRVNEPGSFGTNGFRVSELLIVHQSTKFISFAWVIHTFGVSWKPDLA